jgi:transcriptional regulator with XRE-family HTH domain
MGLDIGIDYRTGKVARMESIGQRIAARRKALLMSQATLGAQVGVDQSVISDIERYNAGFTAETLMGLSRALMLSADFIMKGGDADDYARAELLACWEELTPDKRRSVLDMVSAFARVQQAPAQAVTRKRRSAA